MSWLDCLSNLFTSEPETNLPIQVADDLTLFVEEKRAPRQHFTERLKPFSALDSMDDA